MTIATQHAGEGSGAKGRSQAHSPLAIGRLLLQQMMQKGHGLVIVKAFRLKAIGKIINSLHIA